jgi:ATP-dependent DNA helicase RecQ
LHITRFPSLEKIKAVYTAMVNYLQVPAYSGEHQSFTFRFEDFISNFNLNSRESLYALKALEQDGWIDFNEKNFSPSTLVFTTSKDMLYEFEKSHPKFEPLLTMLLRSYGGIFDFPGFISEKMLAKLLHETEDSIKTHLKRVDSFGVVSYSPQNDDPQIIFRKQRVPVEEFQFNTASYNKRKQAFVQRVEQMMLYLTTNSCRSQFINEYFGDKEARPCGVCDNCLKAGSKRVSTEEFKKFSQMIFHSLKERSHSPEELILQLKGLKKEKAWKIIEFLQAENKVEVDPEGLLRLKNL